MSSPSTAFTYARRLRTAYAVRLRKPYARSVITLLIKHRPDRVRPKLSTQIHRRKESSNQIGAALQFPIRSRSNTLLFAIIMIRHSPNARYDFLGGDSYRGTVHRCLGASISLVSLDYQSDRHCAKTSTWRTCGRSRFDYQSDRHCAKTRGTTTPTSRRLITSQIDTAPKRLAGLISSVRSLITSQIDTAPKRDIAESLRYMSLITSQIDTAPKPLAAR